MDIARVRMRSNNIVRRPYEHTHNILLYADAFKQYHTLTIRAYAHYRIVFYAYVLEHYPMPTTAVTPYDIAVCVNMYNIV